MFDKTKVQEALNRIDGAVSQLQMNRKDHILLLNDVKLLNECCMEYFDDEQELKEARIVRMQDHGGTDQHIVDAEPCHPYFKGSGDGVSGD